MSTFRAVGRLFINYLYGGGDLPSCSNNFPCQRETFHHLQSTFVLTGDLPSTSINFLCVRQIFCQCPRNFCAAGRTFGNFCQLSAQSVNLSSTYVKFHAAGRLSVNFPSDWGTFCQNLSTFRAAGRPSINLRQMSVQLGDFRQLSSTFCAARRFPSTPVVPGDFLSTSVNIPCCLKMFRELPSPFHAAGWTFVNFHCDREIFRQILSTFSTARGPSVKFLCFQENFRQLPSPFRLDGRTSVNFRQLSMQPGELLSTSVNFCVARITSVNFRVAGDLLSIFVSFPCGQETYRQLLSTFRVAKKPSVKFACGQETFR